MAFALVRWMTGRHRGTHTIVNAAWLLDVDLAAFDNQKERSCVVEWRVSTHEQKKSKNPKQKFDLYDAMLVQISDKRRCLEELLQDLQSVEDEGGDCPSDDDLTELEKLKTTSKYEGKKKLQTSKGSVEMSANRRMNEIVKKWNDGTAAETAATATTGLRHKTSELEMKMSEMEAEIHRLNALLVEEIPKLRSDMAKMMIDMTEVLAYQRRQMLMPPVQTSGRNLTAGTLEALPAVSQTQTPVDDKVPLYPGSDVLINRATLDGARQASSATSLVRTLLAALFDKKTLLSSNLKGGSNKRAGPDNSVRLNKLDEHKVEAIYVACREKFPSIPKGVLGQAINGKLMELRIKNREANRDDGANPDRLLD